MKTRIHSLPLSLLGGLLPALLGLLVATVAQGAPTINQWAGGGGADDKWSTAANWTNGVPTSTTATFFTPTDKAVDPYTPNNIVDTSRTIDSLFYWTTNAWQVTQIPAATSLSITGGLTLTAYTGYTADWIFFVGKPNASAPATAGAAITGAGRLVVTNPASMMSVRGYGGYATNDMSALDRFDATVRQLSVGCEGTSDPNNRAAGFLYLAKTNIIRAYQTTANGFFWTGVGLAMGENRANAGSRSFVLMGVSNVFLMDGGIEVGGGRSTGTLIFNPTNAFPGTAFFRGLDGVSRQANWYIGDNNTSTTGTGSDGLADFDTGAGTVDALVGTIYVGRGESGTSAGTGVGTLLIGSGRVDANDLRAGYMRTSGGSATGTVTTSGGASVTNLIVNNNVLLGFDIGNNNAVGTLNIASSVIVKGSIVDGGGTGNTVNLNSGSLWVGGKLGNNAGVNDQPLANLNLYSGTLTLNLGSSGNPITPVCNVQNLNAGDVTLNIEGSGLSPGVVPLIKSYGSGSFAGITPGSLPPKVTGSFSNSTDTLYLVISGVDTPKWKGNVNGNWDINTTANWVSGVVGLPTTYQETTVPGDSVLFDDTGITTTVNLTTKLSPIAIAINNAAKTYTFTSSGSLSGPASLSKQGTGVLILANTGTNDFTGPVTVGGGTLRLSGGDNRLPTNAVINLADAAGTLLDLNGFNQRLGAVYGGGSSGGNITLGTGLLTLSGNGTEFAGVISGAGGLLKTGSGSQILSGVNTYGGGTVISNGTLTVANATDSGIGSGNLLIAGGTLQIGNGSAAGSVPQSVITNNGTLLLNRSDDFVFTNTIVGTGAVTKAATSILSPVGTNTYTGTTTINDGAILISDVRQIGPGLVVIGSSPGARLELMNGLVVTQAIQLAAKSGALNGAPHVQSLNGTNTLTGRIEGTSSTEFSFQSDDGLLIVNGPFTNSSAGGTTALSLRGAALGLWQTSIPGGGAGAAVLTLNKRDSGTWTLTSSSANTYTGPTMLLGSGGTLVVDGAILKSPIVSIGSGSTLAGNGLISSVVSNAVGGFLSPGNASIGTLTISNRLVCMAGSTCVFDVGGGVCDQIRGLSNVTYHGTLQIVLNGGLSANAVFKLFDSMTYSNAFDAFDLPTTLPSPLTWDTSYLNVDGTLRVTGGPAVASFGFGGTTNFQLSGTGSADQPYRILATTNVSLPVSSWPQVGSGTFAGGVFTFTDTNAAKYPRRFYQVVSP